jgi:cytochrome c553
MKIRFVGAALAAVLATVVNAQLPAQRSGAEAKPAKLDICAACHGEDGNSTNPLYPNLAQQNARYVYLQLQDFKAGRRKDPLMSPVAATLDSKETLALADWFSRQKEKSTGFKADPAKVEAGRKIADAQLCSMCHGGNFSGQNEVPREAGQHYEYIRKQLEDFRAKRRTNDGGSMTPVAATLTDEQIDDLAQYVANLY